MTSNNLPQRRGLRLANFDYSSPGAYFVTICVQNRVHLFGKIPDGDVRLNDAGHMVHDSWTAITNQFPSVRLDAFVIMPNHLHGLLWLTSPFTAEQDNVAQPALPDIMQWFKSWTTAQYRQGVVQHDWTPYPKKLWQRSYYDHIVRHDEALNAIRGYIEQNPARWHMDRYNPDSGESDPLVAQIWRLLQEDSG